MNNQTKSAHIFHLIIDPEQQQKGYGEKLISHAEKLITKNNLKKITINVLINNQKAKKFYEKNGFTVFRISKSGKIKMFKNCEHRIPVEGSSLGLDFLKKNLL